MNIEELEKILSTYKITKSNRKVSTTENKSIPFMLTTFRKLIIDDVPPTQYVFVSKFKSDYPNLASVVGLTSRLRVAYLSYIREYHLGYLLNKYFKNVVYDEQADLEGVDYVVYYRRHKFSIHAYVNTRSGRYWRSVKNSRHNFVGRHIDIPIDLKSGNRCGEFILYTDDMIKDLKRRMSNCLKLERTTLNGDTVKSSN